MSGSLISVLIPAYNASAFIVETLASVRAQTWQRLEIIVVDDGSRDDTADVVAGIADARIRLIRQDNAGAAAARNRAILEAQGDFIQFLDADDLIDPDKLSLQMARLAARPDCVATAEWARFWKYPANAAFTPLANWRDMAPMDYLLSSGEGLQMLFPAIWLIPRSIVDAIGPWDTTLSLGDDCEYFTRVALAAREVLHCPGARCRYRVGVPGSLSKSKSAQAWQSQLRVLDSCSAHLLAREDTERVRKTLSILYQQLAHGCAPYSPELCDTALARARHYHEIVIPAAGSPAFRMLASAIGWRKTRHLTTFLRSMLPH